MHGVVRRTLFANIFLILTERLSLLRGQIIRKQDSITRWMGWGSGQTLEVGYYSQSVRLRKRSAQRDREQAKRRKLRAEAKRERKAARKAEKLAKKKEEIRSEIAAKTGADEEGAGVGALAGFLARGEETFEAMEERLAGIEVSSAESSEGAGAEEEEPGEDTAADDESAAEETKDMQWLEKHFKTLDPGRTFDPAERARHIFPLCQPNRLKPTSKELTRAYTQKLISIGKIPDPKDPKKFFEERAERLATAETKRLGRAAEAAGAAGGGGDAAYCLRFENKVEVLQCILLKSVLCSLGAGGKGAVGY